MAYDLRYGPSWNSHRWSPWHDVFLVEPTRQANMPRNLVGIAEPSPAQLGLLLPAQIYRCIFSLGRSSPWKALIAATLTPVSFCMPLVPFAIELRGISSTVNVSGAQGRCGSGKGTDHPGKDMYMGTFTTDFSPGNCERGNIVS